MKRKRFREEQIIGILNEAAGATAVEVCRRHGVSETTYYRWKAKFGGLAVSDAKRLRQLEAENMNHPNGSRPRRLDLSRRKALDAQAPAVPYEGARPGELIHIETKTPGKIAGAGLRITGRRSGMINAHRGSGWEYLQAIVDNASRCLAERRPPIGPNTHGGGLGQRRPRATASAKRRRDLAPPSRAVARNRGSSRSLTDRARRFGYT